MAIAPLITRVPKMSTETVGFTDGMIVTAEDLTVATQYPLALMQVLVRAYFGCGVVCGLSLGQDSRTERRRDVPESPSENVTYTAEIAAGVALDCAGYPLEVCGPVRIDLTPDPCGKPGPITGSETRTLHIAIRRARKADSAGRQGGCGCDCATGGDCGDRDAECSRLRDHVEIGVFEELPEDTCRRPEPVPVNPDDVERDAAGNVVEKRRPSLCDCLTQCLHCRCCGDNWVALGTVTIDKLGITQNGIAYKTRRYVKPIECVCPGDKEPTETQSSTAQDETYYVKLDEYRNEQRVQIDQVRVRAEAAEAQVRTLREAIDQRRGLDDELRTRMDRMERRVTEQAPGTREAPRAPKRAAAAAKKGADAADETDAKK